MNSNSSPNLCLVQSSFRGLRRQQARPRGVGSVPFSWKRLAGGLLVAGAAAIGCFAQETGPDAEEKLSGTAPQALREPTVTEEEAQLLKAVESLADTDLPRATSLLRNGITPESSAAMPFALAVYLFRQEKHALGIEALEDALERLPTFLRARQNVARALVTQDRCADALVHLRDLLADPGADPRETWRLTAYSLLVEGQSLAAETAYRHALVWDPGNPELKLGLLKALLLQRRISEAADLAGMLIPENPGNAQLWRLNANAALEQGNHLEALVILESARRLGLADTAMLTSIGDLYIEQDLAVPALTAYRDAAAFDDAPLDRLLRGAEAMIMTGQTEAATDLLRALKKRSIALSPEQQSRAQRLRAEIALRQGDTDQAVGSLRQLIKQDPLDGESTLQLADLLREKGELDQADTLYERAGSLREFRAQALTGLAQTAVERSHYAVALRYLREALEIRPDPALERYMSEIQELL